MFTLGKEESFVDRGLLRSRVNTVFAAYSADLRRPAPTRRMPRRISRLRSVLRPLASAPSVPTVVPDLRTICVVGGSRSLTLAGNVDFMA